ncbi:MAG: hypothetical protein HRU75_06975 [Planctomycetia bacterium]|nr:MAG: hypothetical protein HRU75_06975 [Planctomycetia bacterium]
MLGEWFFSKLRSAESAMEQGRLDDALRLLGAVRGGSTEGRAVVLRERLARLLSARARVRAQEARYREALDDLEHARGLAPLDPDSEALWARALDALRDAERAQRRQAEAVRAATDQLDAGRLATGRVLADKIEDAAVRHEIRARLDARADRARELLDRARAAQRAGDVTGALLLLSESVTRHGRDDETRDVERSLCLSAMEAADQHWQEGRLDRLGAMIEAANRLPAADPGLAGWARVMEGLRAICAGLHSAGVDELRAGLLRISAGRPTGRWLQDALEATAQLEAARDRLLSSPLMLAGPRSRPAPRDAALETQAAQPRAAQSGARMRLLLVDTAGSALLCMEPTVRIGRSGSSAGLEVAVPADLASHHADVVRVGDDYFLVAHAPTMVNRRSAGRVLLRDGDRVTMGARGRFTFHKPSSRSESAVLRLADRCRLAHDVGQVILFCGTFVIGPHSGAHVQTRDSETRVVVFERGGEMLARQISTDGRHLDAAVPLVEGRPVQIGDQRLTLVSPSAA